MKDAFRVRSWAGPPHQPPIVCLHALGGNRSHWSGVAPRLASLGSVHAVDLAGHGETSGRDGVTLEADRALLDRFLAQTGPAVLVGSSFGGGVAMLQAAMNPPSVRGIVLTGSMLPAHRRDRNAVRTRLVRRRLRQRGRDVKAAAGAIRAGRLRRGTVHEYLLLGNAASIDAMDRDVIDQIVAQQGPSWTTTVRTTLRGGISSLRLVTDPPRFDAVIEAITAPVLVIHGALDRTVPVAQAVQIASARPDWKIVVLDGVGHLPHLEDPDRWLAAVDAWWPAASA